MKIPNLIFSKQKKKNDFLVSFYNFVNPQKYFNEV